MQIFAVTGSEGEVPVSWAWPIILKIELHKFQSKKGKSENTLASKEHGLMRSKTGTVEMQGIFLASKESNKRDPQ